MLLSQPGQTVARPGSVKGCERKCLRPAALLSSVTGSKPILRQILVLESWYRTLSDTWMGLGSLNREAAMPHRLLTWVG